MTNDDVTLRDAITLESSAEGRKLRYYIVTFSGVEKDSLLAEDDGIPQSEIAEAFGEALIGLGVELVTAQVYTSPTLMEFRLLALHEVWANMQNRDKRQIGYISPSLKLAVENLTEGGIDSGNPQDPDHTTTDREAEEGDRERLNHPALNNVENDNWISG